MTKDRDDEYLNRRNEAEDTQEFIGRLLFDTLSVKRDGDARIISLAQSIWGQLRSDSEKQEGYARSGALDQAVTHAILKSIRKEIIEKDIDLSEVTDLLKALAESGKTGAGSIVKALEQHSGKGAQAITEVVKAIQEESGRLRDALVASKPDQVSFEPLLEAHEAGVKVIGRLIVDLTKAVRDAKPTGEVTIKGDVSIKKPVWWKEFKFSLDPVTALLRPIAEDLRKIVERKPLELPLSKDGRIKVEVDRIGGKGGGMAPLNFERGAAKVQSDALGRYRIAEIDDTGGTQYYGYADESGAWYIMRFDTSAKQFRYAVGAAGFPGAWTDRASQEYGYLHEVFNQ